MEVGPANTHTQINLNQSLENIYGASKQNILNVNYLHIQISRDNLAFYEKAHNGNLLLQNPFSYYSSLR